MNPSDPCKHCGACQNHVRCSCCGFCRNCGVYIAAPYWPYYPYTAPYIETPFVNPGSAQTYSGLPDGFTAAGNTVHLDTDSPNIVFTTEPSLPGASNGCFAGATA